MAFNALIQGKEVLKFISKGYRIATYPWTAYSSQSHGIGLGLTGVMERQMIFRIPVKSVRLSTQWVRGKPPPSDLKENAKLKPITLIGNDNKVTVTTLQAAQNISRRNDLKLVKVVDLDAETQRTVYKLVTGAQYHEEDLKQRKLKAAKKQSLAIKGVKTLTFSSRISENDMQNHIRHIINWLAKSYEVRVIINNKTAINSSSADASCDKIHNCIEASVKDVGQLVQKRQNGPNLKFHIMPSIKEGKDAMNDDTCKHVETPEVV